MKLFILGLALLSNLAMAGEPGRAGCGSKTDNIYSLQFGWNSQNQLTDLSITKSDEPNSHSDYEILMFDLKKSEIDFSKSEDVIVLRAKDKKGNSIVLDIIVDESRVGSGTISWKIVGENFEQESETAVCSI